MAYHSPKSVERMRKLHGGTISHAWRVNLTMPLKSPSKPEILAIHPSFPLKTTSHN